ncbi:MAG TPA: Asp-tRNA(Asn)/Glu-tRNA(Gln) amidotransferase GatCAB subunit C, partial [Candidatus Veblenbacteria bacterium]|nr:Asp-tRNA(Asn)/Glu-tRNA(Gln) amidotransferase GatCAB subunit C [Candidatus Veblenbacteria bacterium]
GVKLRADEVKVWPNAEKLIKAAPEQENNAVSVPEVFTNRE